MKFDIVIAHYHENIDWINNLNNELIRNIFVYSKSLNDIILNNKKVIFSRLPNIGRESHTYLNYCVENYNNLPDFVIFLQGDPHGIDVDKINEWINLANNSKANYTNNFKIGCIDWFLQNGKIEEWGGKTDQSRFDVREWAKVYIKDNLKENDYPIFWHACFGVSKKAILSNSIEKYKTIISEELQGKNSEVSHFLERLWFYLFNLNTFEPTDSNLDKNIWMYWAQGWDRAPLLQRIVLSSWRVNNPDWRINLIDDKNIKYYLSKDEAPYLFDKNKNTFVQAKSDILRLELLNKYGGVWADSTLLCMQPLDHWVFDAVKPSGIWMYHGWGGGFDPNVGISSWFIVSKKSSYFINKWREKCVNYWHERYAPHIYFWMDDLFRELFDTDDAFKYFWTITPNICSEDYGQAHCLAKDDGMKINDPNLKQLFEKSPPYVLKFWNHWTDSFPDISSKECQDSNGYFAFKMANRKFQFKHNFK